MVPETRARGSVKQKVDSSVASNLTAASGIETIKVKLQALGGHRRRIIHGGIHRRRTPLLVPPSAPRMTVDICGQRGKWHSSLARHSVHCRSYTPSSAVPGERRTAGRPCGGRPPRHRDSMDGQATGGHGYTQHCRRATMDTRRPRDPRHSRDPYAISHRARKVCCHGATPTSSSSPSH